MGLSRHVVLTDPGQMGGWATPAKPRMNFVTPVSTVSHIQGHFSIALTGKIKFVKMS